MIRALVIAVITLAIGRTAAPAGVKEGKSATEEVEALRSEVRPLRGELQRLKKTEATR